MSMMVSFCADRFPTRCLGWDLELNWVSFWGFSFLPFCVPRDLDDPLAFLSLNPDWIKLVFKDQVIIFLTEKLESQNKIALWERISWVALTSAIRANLPALACMPSAISMSPMSSGSSSSTLQVEKTAEAPSTSNSSFASLRISTHWSAGRLNGGGTWSSRSVNCWPSGTGSGSSARISSIRPSIVATGICNR